MKKIAGFLFLLLILFSLGESLSAQAYLEPEIRQAEKPQTPRDFNLSNGATFNIMVTNNGVGIGGQYRRVVSPFTEAVLELQIGAIKDSREQTFFNVWGQQIIPNKYNRVLAFPLMAGVRQRILANTIADNFRIYLQGMVGPSMTLLIPYFDDVLFTEANFPSAQNPDGLPLGVRRSSGQINDIFQGWGDAELVFGYAGKAALSIDFGSSFSTLTTLEFGVQLFYYPDGIQIMEPNSLVIANGVIADRIIGGGFDSQKWSVSPTITLMFGGMW